MSWEKESILILVRAAPNWSTKYKTYEICTAGISQTEDWRRLYPFPETNVIKRGVRIWDLRQRHLVCLGNYKKKTLEKMDGSRSLMDEEEALDPSGNPLSE